MQRVLPLTFNLFNSIGPDAAHHVYGIASLDRPRPSFVLILLSAKRCPRKCRVASLKCKFMRNRSDLCGLSNDLQTSSKLTMFTLTI